MLQELFLNDEEKQIQEEVRTFVREEVSAELLRQMDKNEITYPKEFVRALGRRNLLGLRFAKKYGGRGLNWSAEMAALEEIGVLGMALGCAFSMPSIVGQALAGFGSEDLRERFLKPMLKGKLISAEALTEPRGGSDFFGAATVAKADGNDFIIRGQKRFVVAASGADFFVVYCKTDPEGKPHQRISLILIESDRKGVEVKHLYNLMGTRGGGTGRLLFRDVRVPRTNLIGELNQGARIFHSMMIPERLTSAGGSLGLARAALEIAARYSNRRRAFGRPIRDYQAVSFKVADAITQLDAARALCQGACRAADRDLPSARRLVSEAKKFSTDMCWEVCNKAMGIVGGIGYTTIFPIEKMVRDARLSQIWTGTNEIMSLLIQHEYYKELLQGPHPSRISEHDAEESHLEEEKVYEDDEMWTKGW